MIESLYPLSSTQAGMVFHSLAEPEAGIYVGRSAFSWQETLIPS